MKTYAITGLSKEYKTEPIDVCRTLNKTIKNGNYWTIIDSENNGFYVVKLNWAIENDFLYSIYW